MTVGTTVDTTETTTGRTLGTTTRTAGRGGAYRLDYVPVQASFRRNGGIIPMSLRSVHFVMPGGVDDRSAPSGGNAYDRRVCLDLPGFGWQPHRHPVPGDWPRPDAAARDGLARTLRELPDGAVVLLDGLVACGVPEVIVPEAEAGRLHMVVLVHLPLGDETGLDAAVAAELDARERAVLRAVPAVVATSEWAVRPRSSPTTGSLPSGCMSPPPAPTSRPSPRAPTASLTWCASPRSPRARASTGWWRRWRR